MKKNILNKNTKISKKTLFIIFLIFFFTISLINYYNKHLNSRIIEVSKMKLLKFTESFLSNNVSYEMFEDINFDNIITINKNNDGEILYVDYDLKRSYQILDIVSKELNELLTNLEQGKYENINDKNIISTKYGLVLKVPMFISSNNALFSNVGPNIYMKVNFIGAILTNIKTKITSYGLNNALVEMYVTIKINEELMSPVSDKINEIKYDVLIGSKVINGRVPLAYGGIIESKSNILSIPIEE